MWRDYDHRAAVREAKAAGFVWMESVHPPEAIREDWHEAFRKATWTRSYRHLILGKVPDLTLYRSLIHRLRPTWLWVSGCENVDALKGLTALQELDLIGCTNIPATALRELLAALPKTNIRFPDATISLPP